MPHKKRRVVQSMMMEKSETILRNKIPEEWVLHRYAPDYGIDFVVETFEYIDNKHNIAETLGEFFFVQLKSTESTERETLTVKSRYNIEKYKDVNTSEKAEISVIKYPLEIDEIITVQSMGVSVPVVLFLVDLTTENVFFICLNDYIEKILYTEQKLNHRSSITLYIPKDNNIDSKRCLCHLSFLARRSKLFGAFNKFNYQRHELNYDQSPEIILHFISIIKRYDFWNARVIWPALIGMYEELKEIEGFLTQEDLDNKITILHNKGLSNDYFFESVADANDFYIGFFVIPFWDRLCNLGRIYEEICKEWFLPTYFWYEGY